MPTYNSDCISIFPPKADANYLHELIPIPIPELSKLVFYPSMVLMFPKRFNEFDILSRDIPIPVSWIIKVKSLRG